MVKNPNKSDEKGKVSQRTIVLASIGLAVVIAGYVLFSGDDRPKSEAAIQGAPDIESIPGIGDPSVEYGRLIAEQNKAQAEEAERTEGSSLPTIIRPQYSLDADEFADQYGREKFERDVNKCSLDNLLRARDAGVEPSELKCYGCSAEDLRQAGYLASELRKAGYSAEELKAAGFSATELRKAGFNAVEKRVAGYSASQLLEAQYSVRDLLDAGFTPRQLLDSGVSINALRMAGVTDEELIAAGVNPADLIREGYCSEKVFYKLDDKRQLRADGVSATVLYESGVAVSDILSLGYQAGEMISAGVSVSQLMQEGVEASDLLRAGVTNKEISFAKKNLAQLKGGRCSSAYVRSQFDAGVKANVLIPLGCKPKMLRDSGYSANELIMFGVTAGQLRKAGYSAGDLVSAGLSAKNLVDGCYPVDELLEAGFTAKQLLDAGIPISKLLGAGASIAALKDSGMSCADMFKGGVPITQLLNLGCEASELLQAGASVTDLLSGGYSVSDLRNAGATASDLLAAGVAIGDLLDAGYRASDLLAAGVTEGALIRAGVDASELYGGDSGIGCSVERINSAFASGKTVRDLLDDGCSIESLINAGVSLEELINAGVTAEQLAAASDALLAAGFTIEDLLKAGISAEELASSGLLKAYIDSGVGIQELLDAGLSIEDIVESGMLDVLVKSGLTAKELLDAGFTAKMLANAKMSADEMYLAGVSLSDMKGYPFNELRAAGYDVSEEDVDDPFSMSEESDLEKMQRMQDEEMLSQDRERRISQLATAMQAQATNMFTEFDTPARQSLNDPGKKPTAYGRFKLMKEVLEGLADQDSGGLISTNFVKAGNLMYATLDTTINSEDPTPILATIISGPLKGSKLIGEFEQNGSKLVLKFDRIDRPSQKNTQDVTLFAVDVNTVRNVTVDSHYLLKYGSLFASSFLSGLNAVAKNVGTSVSTNGDTVTIKEGGLDKSKIISAGLGKVGDSLVTEAEKFQEKIPTIRMKEGATFGVLLMEDFPLL